MSSAFWVSLGYASPFPLPSPFCDSLVPFLPRCPPLPFGKHSGSLAKMTSGGSFQLTFIHDGPLKSEPWELGFWEGEVLGHSFSLPLPWHLHQLSLSTTMMEMGRWVRCVCWVTGRVHGVLFANDPSCSPAASPLKSPTGEARRAALCRGSAFSSPAGAEPQRGSPFDASARSAPLPSIPHLHAPPGPAALAVTTPGSSVQRGGRWEQVRCRMTGRASVLRSLPDKGMSYVPQTLDRIHLTRHPREICAPAGHLLAGQLGIRQEAQALPTVPPYFLGTAQPCFWSPPYLDVSLKERGPPTSKTHLGSDSTSNQRYRDLPHFGSRSGGPSLLPNWEK